MKTNVYAVKTKKGYGLFCNLKLPITECVDCSAVFTTQITDLKDVKTAINGEYYCACLCIKLPTSVNKWETTIKGFEIINLGKYKVKDIEYPKRFRSFELHSLYTWKYHWGIMGRMNILFITQMNNKKTIKI